MSGTTLVEQLREIGIAMRLDERRLRIEGKPGALTDNVRDLIRARRFEIIAELTPDVPSYIKRCATCGGTDWGPTGHYEHDGCPIWGCLPCATDRGRDSPRRRPVHAAQRGDEG